MIVRKLLPLIGILLFVVACDDMTQTTKVPLGGPTQATVTKSCSYAGLCQACEFRANGKQKCWLGFHQSCDGHRDAVVNAQKYKTTYKSGRQDIETETTVDHYLGDCK